MSLCQLTDRQGRLEECVSAHVVRCTIGRALWRAARQRDCGAVRSLVRIYRDARAAELAARAALAAARPEGG